MPNVGELRKAEGRLRRIHFPRRWMNKGDTGSVGISSYLSGDPPSVTRGVFHPAAAVGVAFPALRLIDRDTTGLQGALVGGIDIGYVNVEPHGEGEVVAPAVEPLVASCLPGVERLDQKVYNALRSLGHYVRQDARMPFRLVRAIHRAFLPLSRRRLPPWIDVGSVIILAVDAFASARF